MSKEELDRIEFCYAISIVERDWTKKVLPSLQVYRREFGDCLVPTAFVVPACPPWPEKAWGMPLGIVVSRCRFGDWYAEQTTRDRDVLDALGFAWSRSDAVWNDSIMPALKTFVDVYKNGNVPCKFVVPSQAPWPEKAWGMPLGKVVDAIRQEKCYAEQATRDRPVLDALGFVWNRSDAVWNEVIVPAVEAYVDVHKHGKVPVKFLVPPEAPWPERAWGKRLGGILSDMRCKGTYFGQYGRDIKHLDELGLNLKLSSRAWRERVVPLLDVYAELHGEREVPHDFVIPSEAPWEEKLWGVCLGLIVARNLQFSPRR